MNIKLSATLMAMFVATSAFADADHGYPESAIPARASAGDTAQAQHPAPDKTRAQVRQDLIEAERAGLVPSPKNDYPPSQAAIERNKARFGLAKHYLASK
jgi:hypothetical protein